MKLLTRGAFIFGVLVIVALGAVWVNLSHIVRTEVEKEATKSLRLNTTLNSASISLLGGQFGLHGLAIGSPRGFSAPHMFEMDGVDVGVRYRELRDKPIHVQSLTIDKPKLVIEQSGGALNFRKAMELQPASDPNQPPMKLVIDQLNVRDAQVLIHPGLPGVQEEIAVKVPSLVMKDVGHGTGARNGAAIKDVTMQVISALAAKAAESGDLPPQLKALLHLNASQLAASLGGEAARNIAGALPGDVGKQLKADPAALEKDPAKTLQGFLPSGRQKRQ